MNWLRRKLLWWGIVKLVRAKPKPKPGNILVLYISQEGKFMGVTEVEGGQLPK